MRWKNTIMILIAIVIAMASVATAYDFDPGRDINLRDIYDIKNAVNIDTACLNLSGDNRCAWLLDPEGIPVHNQLSGLQGGTTDQYYHINQSVHDTIISNVFSWITSAFFDQGLNTTDSVTFINVTANWFKGKFNWTEISKYLSFDGSTLDFSEAELNSTIDLRTISNYYNASLISTISGTHDGGNLTSIIFPEDDDTYNVSEDVGADPLTIAINFSNVESFDSIVGRIYYDGGLGHIIQLEIQRSDTGIWENYLDLTDTSDFVNIYVPVFDPELHVFGNGDVAIRFNHIQSGIPIHNFYIDYLTIVDGWTTLTVAEHDSLGGRNDPNNHPWALDKAGSKALTGDWQIGEHNITNASWLQTVNLNVTGLIYGNGSQLTGITTTETDPLWTGNETNVARVGDCPEGQFVKNTTIGGVECAAPTGEGDITGVYGDNIYIYNGSGSGEVTLAMNETKLNETIDLRDSDTTYSASGILLDLTGTTFSVNEGTLTSGKGCKFVTGTGIVCDQTYLTDYTETDPLWTGNQSLVYLKSNPFSFVNTTTASDLNYLILSKWANITDAPTNLSFFTDDLGNRGYTYLTNFTDDLGDRGYTHLTNFTDNLGNRGYTHLTNFTDDILWTTGFNATGDTRWLTSYTETDPLWSDNSSTVARTGNCPAGQVVMNTTTGGVQCITPPAGEETNVSILYGKNTSSSNIVPVEIADNGALKLSVTNLGEFGGWKNVGTYVYLETIGHSVGIGTETPGSKLEVIGAIRATDWTNVTITESQVSDADWWDADGDINADEISESKIAFSTACASGSYYYLSGNDLACKADPLDTITEWNALCNNCVADGDVVDTITASNYVRKNTWTDIDDYPSACSAGYYVRGLGDTLTCTADPLDTILEWQNLCTSCVGTGDLDTDYISEIELSSLSELNAQITDATFYTVCAADNARVGTNCIDILTETELDTLNELDTQIGITGTPSDTTYWRGDNSWATPSAAGVPMSYLNYSTASQGTGNLTNGTLVITTGANDLIWISYMVVSELVSTGDDADYFLYRDGLQLPGTITAESNVDVQSGARFTASVSIRDIPGEGIHTYQVYAATDGTVVGVTISAIHFS